MKDEVAWKEFVATGSDRCCCVSVVSSRLVSLNVWMKLFSLDESVQSFEKLKRGKTIGPNSNA